MGSGIIAAVISAIKMFNNMSKSSNEAINDLSVEILNLSKKSQAIDTAISKFDELDNKLIKTKKDAEAMAEALDSAADKLSSDRENNTRGLNLGNISEKDYYSSLTTNRARKEFLEQVSQLSKEQADEDRRRQLQIVQDLRARGGNAWQNFLTDADKAQARDAIYAIANNNLYKNIDLLKQQGQLSQEAASATESFTQALIENIDNFDTIMEYADEDSQAFKDLVSAITSAEMQLDSVTVKTATILDSEDYSLKEKVAAFQDMRAVLVGNAEALESFNDLYSQYTVFEEMGDDVLDFIDKSHISIEELNKLYQGYEQLQKAGLNISQEDYQARFSNYLEALTQFHGDVAAATHAVFDDLLATADDYTKA